MSTYIIRVYEDDEAIWKAAKARAHADGRSIKWILLALLRHYAAKGLPK